MHLTLKQALQEAKDVAEKAYLIEVLQEAGGSAHVAARLADCNRTGFYKLLDRHGLSRPSKRRDAIIRGIAESSITAARRKRHLQERLMIQAPPDRTSAQP